MLTDNEWKNKKIAVIILTPAAKKIALNLKKEITELNLFIPAKLKNEHKIKTAEKEKIKQNQNIYYYNNSLRGLIEEIFKEYDALIFVMALGIVVRIIAPLLESKQSDPAVITIDDLGSNVISTLSGHLGGANQLTEAVAEILNSNPVITTATDINDKLAVDLLAKQLNCEIKPFSRLKKANSALLFSKKLNFFSDYKINVKEEKNLKKYPLADLNKGSKASLKNENFLLQDSEQYRQEDNSFDLIISNQKFELKENQIQLIPKNIVIGIGCRKNTLAVEIENAFTKVLAALKLCRESVKKIATIDLKKDEAGILEFAAANNLPLEIVARSEIKKVEAELEIKKSNFVKKTIGVAAAAAPAAILSSARGKLILDKQKFPGITLAVFEEEIIDE